MWALNWAVDCRLNYRGQFHVAYTTPDCPTQEIRKRRRPNIQTPNVSELEVAALPVLSLPNGPALRRNKLYRHYGADNKENPDSPFEPNTIN